MGQVQGQPFDDQGGDCGEEGGRTGGRGSKDVEVTSLVTEGKEGRGAGTCPAVLTGSPPCLTVLMSGPGWANHALFSIQGLRIPPLPALGAKLCLHISNEVLGGIAVSAFSVTRLQNLGTVGTVPRMVGARTPDRVALCNKGQLDRPSFHHLSYS